MKLRQLALAAVVSAVSFVSADAWAAPWVPPSGSTANFIYAGGGDDNGLFGSPTSVTPVGFDFLPANFKAVSLGGVPALTTDRLYVTLAGPGGAASISQITFKEIGDYSIQGAGGVKAFVFLAVRVLDANYGPVVDFTATDVFDLTSPPGTAQGVFDLLAQINLPRPASRVQVVLNNNLHANSSANGSAIIQKKLADLDVNIPEPTTITAVTGLTLLTFRRRRAA